MNDNFEQTVKDMLTSIKETMWTPIHPAGWPFIGGFAVVSLILTMIWEPLGILGFLLTVLCLYFFRDPDRVVPDRSGVVISPADGKVSAIEYDVSLPEELASAKNKDGYTRVSVFLSVLNVHVNRVPVSGTVREVAYRPGEFFNANLDKASEENERSSALIETSDRHEVAVVQIAGLIARRIVNTMKTGTLVNGGERYGIIRFGSRLDVYLPAETEIRVLVGQIAIGGETILGEFKK